MAPPRLGIIGPGRAGGALALALSRAGWQVGPVLGRDDDPAGAADGVDLLVIATPDPAIPTVARAVEPVGTTVVAHLAGSLGLGVLAPHRCRAAVHPLAALADPVTGAERLASGVWFAVAGSDPASSAVAERVVADLGGRAFGVADPDRALYHAAAVVASNHLVALLGQVERLAAAAGVPFEAYLDLVRTTLDNVGGQGPAGALTGPAARGDQATIDRHLAAMDSTEREAYRVLSESARRLAQQGPGPTTNRTVPWR